MNDEMLNEMRTREGCLAAVLKNPYDFEYVPDELLDEEICIAAVCGEDVSGMILMNVPQRFRTRAVCLAAMHHCGGLIDVPEELRDREMCTAALKCGYKYKFPCSFREEAVPEDIWRDPEFTAMHDKYGRYWERV